MTWFVTKKRLIRFACVQCAVASGPAVDGWLSIIEFSNAKKGKKMKQGTPSSMPTNSVRQQPHLFLPKVLITDKDLGLQATPTPPL